MTFPNPLIPGFNPDPSVVAVGGAYYLVTSTFEYLPGIPVYRSTDLYRRGGYWYLMIAEGGTERGHAVSVARGPSPAGPFEGHPANPVLSARSTSRPVQNTGHADLVATGDGGDALVLLGVRPLGAMQSFSPLGRETFITPVSWADGWPQPEPVQLAPRDGVEEAFDFADPSSLDDPGWLAVRTTPASVASAAGGGLSITGRAGLDDPHPRFVGRRQRHLSAAVSATVDASAGAGGLAARYDEDHWFALEARGTVVTVRARLADIEQTWQATVPAGVVELRMEMSPPPSGFGQAALGGDRIRLLAGGTLLAELDGRYWTAETCASFTGRVIGLYACGGTVRFTGFRYRGSDADPGQIGAGG